MDTEQTTDQRIQWSYGSPRLRAPGLNCYQRRPERDRWTEFEVYRRPDGTGYRREREVSRWAGSYSEGRWSEIELDAEKICEISAHVAEHGSYPGEVDAWRREADRRTPPMRDRFSGRLVIARGNPRERAWAEFAQSGHRLA